MTLTCGRLKMMMIITSHSRVVSGWVEGGGGGEGDTGQIRVMLPILTSSMKI